MSTHDFAKFFDDAKSRTVYWTEKAVLDFTEEVVARMKALSMNRSELAERLRVKPAFITKILRGDNNFTIETMAKVGRALKSRVRVHLEPDGQDSQWLDFLKEHPGEFAAATREVPTLNKENFQKIIQKSELVTT